MAYKYQYIEDRNEKILAPLNLPERFKNGFRFELTFKESHMASAQEQETHGNIEKARSDYEIAEKRTTFMLGMIDTLRMLGMLDEETDRALVNLAYGRNV